MNLLNNISNRFEDILIGISEKTDRTTQEGIREKYEQAQFGLKVGRYKGQKINEWKDLGYDKYLYAVQQNEILQTSALDFLKPLIEHDEKFNSELILTLSVYLDNFFSLKKSAEELFIHKNTVKYRIDKIKELYKDRNLEEPESYLLFSSSLKLYMILEKK
ncbi:helix-turn-helix domain-containing protein [Oceanobacillus manasiensis]|uniref:PucR family transcriptional regulator n=1 Tax=Oceanobacillus manasiensis TaxID=586413 RepID=UPI0018DB696E|nr:helix-turn-helix domain-containing protein [Oceanobacillus manasiensis]